MLSQCPSTWFLFSFITDFGQVVFHKYWYIFLTVWVVDDDCRIGVLQWAGRSWWSHGVMVSTLDFESSDPSSNLGGTFCFVRIYLWPLHFVHAKVVCLTVLSDSPGIRPTLLCPPRGQANWVIVQPTRSIGQWAWRLLVVFVFGCFELLISRLMY